MDIMIVKEQSCWLPHLVMSLSRAQSESSEMIPTVLNTYRNQ